jgi:anthranilate phosphoribosyltransferase
LGGGDAPANANIIRALLKGEKSPKRDVVILNAAAALVAAGKTDSIRDALPFAEASLDKGAAGAKLEALVRFSHAHPASA